MVAQVSTTKRPLRIERIQATRQLEYLGFERGSKVPLRFFYHSDDPRKDGDKGRKLDRLKWEEVERLQSEGRGVYVVVNGHRGGHEDKDISQCIAVFCEWDDMPLEEQVLYWDTVGFLEPTFTVYSGDKSMQPYWVFDKPLTNIDQWRELQQLLIEVMNADPANKNPSRVFRLAGGWHIKPGRDPVRTEIVQDSGKKYSVEELLMKLREIKHQRQPDQKPLAARYEDIQVPVPESVPLEVCLSKESRSLLSSGVSEGGRNTNGAKLARDLIGTADHLASIGQQFNGDARSLLEDYAHHCNPPLPSKEVEAIWKSAQKDRPKPSCPPDYIENNIRAWYWREYVKPTGRGYGGGIGGGGNRRGNGGAGGSGGDGGGGGDDGNGGDGGNGKVVTHPKFTPITGDELDQRINELIAQKITGSKLTTHLNRLAVEAQWHINELKKLYFERKGEIEQTEEQVEAKELLPSLLEVHRLDLREFLWGDEGLLAEAMLETAKAMPTSPEFLFTTLLPTAATLIGTSSRIVLKARGKYKQPCILWTTVVARSGQLKTPAQRVVLDPLIQLEIKANEQYQADLEQYEIDLAYWKKDKNADPADKPKKPIRKRYVTKDATIEALERIHGENPRGLLVHRDEIAEDFKADNVYRNGKGCDREKKLDQFNGSPLIIDRKEREIALERSAISRTGSIQWEVLQSLMGDGRDDNGTFARWLFCAAESPPRFINLLEDDEDTGIEELLLHLYKRLEVMPENRDYLLSFEAKQLFQQWQHELVRLEFEESHPGLQLVYPKIEAYTARFALWLHLVNSALAEITPPAIVSERTMSAAIKLAKYYLDQSKLVLVTNTPQSGLTGVLLKIQKYAQGKPNGVKVYKLKSAIKALKNTPQEELLSHCRWLSEHGYGSLKDNSYFVDRVDQLLTSGSTRSTPDSVVVSAKPSVELLTNCCPKVNTVNTSNNGGSSDFVDFVDQIDPQNMGFSLQNLTNTQEEGNRQDPASITTCNENSHCSLLAVNTVNTVNKNAEPHIESGVDQGQQEVNKGQHGQQTEGTNGDDAPTPPLAELAQATTTAGEEVSQTDPMESEGVIADLTQMLELCDSIECLVALRQTEGFTPSLLNKACKQLSPENHAQIRQWVIELNQEPKAGDRVFVNSWPHTDKLGPYLIEHIEGGRAKLEMFDNLVLLSDLRLAN